jgi:hypothetical protein
LALSKKLEEAVVVANSKLCKLATVLAGPEISLEDKKHIEEILATPESNPARVPNTTLGRILREEGYDVSNSAIDRHRRGDCPCNRLVK